MTVASKPRRFGGIIDQPFAGFGFVFFVGASRAAYADTIRLNTSVAAVLPARFQWMGRKNDYSFGMAGLSWNLVERPALSLKSRGLGRLVAR